MPSPTSKNISKQKINWIFEDEDESRGQSETAPESQTKNSSRRRKTPIRIEKLDSEVEPVEEPVALSPERNEKNMMNQL